MGLSTLYFELQYKSRSTKIQLNELSKVVLEKRRKLAPLVLGGLITSLSLLSIFLYSASLEVAGLAAFGLLLTYYGFQEHTVLHIEYSNNSLLVWLPLRSTLNSVRPFVAMLEYYIIKQHFPILFARTDNTGARMVHFENIAQTAQTTIFYRFGAGQASDNKTLAVNPILLDMPLNFNGEEHIIARGEYLINQAALIENDSISYS